MAPRRDGTDRGSERQWGPLVPVLGVALLAVLAGCGAGGGPTVSATSDDTTTVRATGSLTPTAPDPPSPTTSSPSADPSTRTPTATPSPTATPTVGNVSAGDFAIPVRGNGSIPFDVNRTYARTLELLNVGAAPPSQVFLYRSDAPYRPTVREPFARVLLDARRTSNLTIPRKRGVVMEAAGYSALELRYTLAHEFVHNVQFERTEGTAVREAAFYAEDHQRRRVATAVMEGSASYVALRQVVRYTDRDEASVLSVVDEYRNASPAGKFVWAPYHFGRRYLERRADSPADHWRFYRDPPETSEELIHGLAPGSEPPAPLSTTVEAEGWSIEERETRGEMFLRVVLAAELPEQRAAAGAAGWGNDELLRLETDDGTGYAWAIRWDAPGEATEFGEAFRAAMDRRGDRTGDAWVANGTAIRIRRVAPETVVVFAGAESFVSEAGAEGGNGSVTVGRRGEDGSQSASPAIRPGRRSEREPQAW